MSASFARWPSPRAMTGSRPSWRRRPTIRRSASGAWRTSIASSRSMACCQEWPWIGGGDSLVVTHISAASPARGKVSVGEGIEGLVEKNQLRQLKSPRDFYEAIWRIPPGESVTLRIRDGEGKSRDVSLPVGQGIEQAQAAAGAVRDPRRQGGRARMDRLGPGRALRGQHAGDRSAASAGTSTRAIRSGQPPSPPPTSTAPPIAARTSSATWSRRATWPGPGRLEAGPSAAQAGPGPAQSRKRGPSCTKVGDLLLVQRDPPRRPVDA